MPGLFITASGTDIGKTFVTAGLIRAMRDKGLKVEALKPIVSGFDEADAAGSDPAVLLDALERPLNSDALDAMSPWRFKAPLSPDMAARLEKREIDFDQLAAYCGKAIAANDGLTLIEGAGGLMVPLNAKRTVLDLIETLATPVVLVGATYLGAISHLLTAVEVLKTHCMPISAIVINESEDSSVSMKDTLETLSHFCDGLPLVPVRRQKQGATSPEAFAHLLQILRIA